MPTVADQIVETLKGAGVRRVWGKRGRARTICGS
jgi:hypothetical protein